MGQDLGEAEKPGHVFSDGNRLRDEGQGWIVTERTNILHTEDGGKTWAVQFKDQDFILKSVSFCDERNGWAVGSTGTSTTLRMAAGPGSTSRGEFGFSEETGEVVGGNYLFDVAAVNPKTAWIGRDRRLCGEDGGCRQDMAEADDGGAEDALFGVCVGEKGVLIAGDAVLLRTTDGERPGGMSRSSRRSGTGGSTGSARGGKKGSWRWVCGVDLRCGRRRRGVETRGNPIAPRIDGLLKRSEDLETKSSLKDSAGSWRNTSSRFSCSCWSSPRLRVGSPGMRTEVVLSEMFPHDHPYLKLMGGSGRFSAAAVPGW